MTRIFDEDASAGFGTRAIHAGQRPDLLSGAIMTPIYTTSTYVQEGLGDNMDTSTRAERIPPVKRSSEMSPPLKAAYTALLSRAAWAVSIP